MALCIKNREAHRLATELARLTGETLTQAVTRALRERLQRESGRTTVPDLAEELMEIGRRCAALPVLVCCLASLLTVGSARPAG